MQTVLYPLPSQTFTAQGSVSVPLRNVPRKHLGRFVHLAGLIFDCAVTPTFTTAPTVSGINNLVKTLEIWDGKLNRFAGGGFNYLRVKERLSAGGIRQPEPDSDTASGTTRYFRRVWHPGPVNFAGAPADFALPAGLLENAEVRMSFGAITDLSADCTAATGTVRIYAVLALMDEIRIPPAVQFVAQNLNSADAQLAGRALYLNLALLNSSAVDAISAGDFGNIHLDLGFGEVVAGIPGSALTALYHDQYQAGAGVGGLQGEPAGASDDNVKAVNSSSPTALSSSAADVQVVLYAGPNAKLSKCPLAESSARIRWTGAQTSAVVLMERILEQPQGVLGELTTRALQAVDAKGFRDIRAKTLSKKPYTGPLKAFMPWTAKVG